MRQIVNGLLYDTEISKEIHSSKVLEWYEFGSGARRETLYETPSGRYFLLKGPFAMSMQRMCVIPLTKGEANDWLQGNRARIDAYQALDIEVRPA